MKKKKPRNHSKKTETTMISDQQGGTHSVEPCDTCGGVGWPELIVTCSKCNVAREHIYCMQIFIRGIRDDWICKTCYDENDTISLNMNISRDPIFDASNDITEHEITPSTSGVRKTSTTKEHASHSLGTGGSTSRENSTAFVSKHYGNMDSSDELQSDKGSSEDKSDKGEPVVRRVRGSTKPRVLFACREEQQKRVHVDFDTNMNPIGDEEDRFISYLGYLARSKVGILYSNWKLVPLTTKDIIWQQILQIYDVPDTKAMNKYWMEEIRLRWKDFKTRLTRHYIRGARRNQNPCAKYSYLSPEDWRLFVVSRQDPKFVELSKANKERQARNKYQHYMSRGGYRKLERKLMEKELEEMKEVAKSNPSIAVHTPVPPPRHKKWKVGRMKGDKYINSVVADVARRIDELEGKSSQCSFTPVGRMDILSTAIGKPDHPGRVRAEPRGVGLTKYFGRASQYSSRGEPTRELMAKIREEVRQELEVQLRQSLREELLHELRGEVRSIIQSEKEHKERRTRDSSAFSNSKRSYNPLKVPVGDPSPTPIAGEPCTLYLDVPLLHVVADALVHTQSTTHHHKQIPDNLRKVTVTCVKKGEEATDAPIPDEEVVKLGQAIGSFILWPENLIYTATTPPMDQQDGTKFPFLAQLQVLHKKIDKIDLHMPYGIVGERLSYPFTIDRKDLKEFIYLEEIDIGWVKLAIIFFHNICVETERSSLYGFLCPANLAKKYNKMEARMSYLGFTIQETKLPCYLAPIVEGYHWSLCVACPIINTIYWFDSLGRKPNEEIKAIFNIVFKTYTIIGGRCEGTNREVKWFYPTCPQQPGRTECGYYVLLYVYNIIQSGISTNLEQIFDNSNSYTDKDLNLIRDLLAGHLLQHINDE